VLCRARSQHTVQRDRVVVVLVSRERSRSLLVRGGFPVGMDTMRFSRIGSVQVIGREHARPNQR